MVSEGVVHVLLDTDIGSDIDDAICLAYLLSQPRCDLVGITTVTGEARRRASLADLLCRAAGRTDVPIHSGSEKPLFGPQMQPEAQQAEVLERLEHRSGFAANEAVEFLRSTIRSRPGEITLLTIGPLSNAGLLFAVDPEIPGMLKSLVMMCGVFTSCMPGLPHREWNAMCDPYASALVYGAPAKEHVSYGLDVTMRCTMDAGECRSLFKGELLGVVAEMAEVWFRRAPHVTFHDPLAAASIFEPDICRYQHGRVAVEIQSALVPGMTVWTPDANGPHRIAVDVDSERFFDHYFGVTARR